MNNSSKKLFHVSNFLVKIVKGAMKCKRGQTWGVKIARLKLGGPKSHNQETRGAKIAI
jgi:hypothetical protein